MTVLRAISIWRPPRATCSMAVSKGKKNHDLLNFQFNFPSRRRRNNARLLPFDMTVREL